MKALLYKDFLVLWKQMKFVIFMVAIFCMMPDTGLSLNAFFVAYSGLIVPVTLFAYDERAKWDSLAAMMPFSTRDMVLSRYVFSWLAIAYAVLCYLAGMLLFQSGLLEDALITMGLTLTLLLVVQAVYFPILFRLGSEKGRMLLFLVIIGIMVLAFLGAAILDKLAITPSPSVTLPGLVIGAVLSLASVKVSVKQYEQRVW